MLFFDLFFKKKLNKKHTSLKTHKTDEFADRISVELTTAAVEAITEILQLKEGKYLKSILEESFFPLQSLVFIPSDFQTAKSVEEFIRIHKAIDKNFKNSFLRGVLQSEYCSNRGGTVIVSEDFVPEIQLDEKSIENRSDEENFQISLGGRKILFRAEAILGTPIRKEVFLQSNNLRQSHHNVLDQKKRKKAKLLISDGDGHREVDVVVPFIIGRVPGKDCLDYGVEPIHINAKFVSRRQMFIFEMIEQVFCLIPESASLTCSTLNGERLKPGKVYSINSHTGDRFYFGVPLDHDGPITGNTDPSEFPIVEIIFDKNFKPTTGTPLPKIDK